MILHLLKLNKIVSRVPDYERKNITTRDVIFTEDRNKIRQIIWELIIQGILVPGLNSDNQNLPWVSLTEYGRKVVSMKEVQPHDPDRYLEFVKSEIPNLDDEIKRYLTESLQAYLRGLNLSSAVTLGVASEKAFSLLMEALTNSYENPDKKKHFLKLQESISIKGKFDQVKKRDFGH